jgi:hypothetical protein
MGLRVPLSSSFQGSDLSSSFHRPDLDNFILVYTMGKVGSTALIRSLEAVNLFCRHLQWLRPETDAYFEKLSKLYGPNSIFVTLQSLNRARAHSAIRHRDYAEIIKVITAVRAPIEQILSQYFQSFESLYERQIKASNKPISPESVIENILAGVRYFLARPDRTLSDLTDELTIENRFLNYFCWMVYNYLTWFDLELLPFFPSPILGGRLTDGYQLARNVMILKFEELQTDGERAVAAYTQRQFRLLRENVGADKAHGDLYREVLRTIKFPRAFVDYLCDSKYVRHFYSEDERQAQKSRWTG